MEQKMFELLILVLIALAPASALAIGLGMSETPFSKDLTSDLGNYSVSVNPKEKKVDVVKIEGNAQTPPHVRIKILRKDDRPLEIGLRTIESPKAPVTYSGHFDQWKDSYLGMQVEFSFDKKTWKKLGALLSTVVP
jgi:hypothetical protein